MNVLCGSVSRNWFRLVSSQDTYVFFWKVWSIPGQMESAGEGIAHWKSWDGKGWVGDWIQGIKAVQVTGCPLISSLVYMWTTENLSTAVEFHPYFGEGSSNDAGAEVGEARGIYPEEQDPNRIEAQLAIRSLTCWWVLSIFSSDNSPPIGWGMFKENP